MRMTNASHICLALFFATIACSKESKKESSDAKPATATGLALSAATAAESFDLVTTAVQSFDEAIEKAAGSLAIELEGDGGGEEEEAPNLSKWCSGHGEPLATADETYSSLRLEDENRLSATDSKYAARLFHCKMKVDSGDPETIRGIIGFPKGIICAMEKEGLIDFENPGTKEGSIEMTTDCFSENFIASMERQGYEMETTLKVTTSILDEVEGGWQKQIYISEIAIDEATEIRLKLFNSTELMSMMVQQINNGDEADQTTSVFGLTESGELRVENKVYRIANQSGDKFNLAMRIFAKGDLAIEEKKGILNAEFTDFDSYDGIFISLNPPDAEQNRSYYSGQLATITGTVDAGYLTKTYACNMDGIGPNGGTVCDPSDSISTFYETNNGEGVCVPSDKDCDGLEAIEFDGTDFLMPELDPDTAEFTSNTWAEGLKGPLDFTTINTDFAQYPK